MNNNSILNELPEIIQNNTEEENTEVIAPAAEEIMAPAEENNNLPEQILEPAEEPEEITAPVVEEIEPEIIVDQESAVSEPTELTTPSPMFIGETPP